MSFKRVLWLGVLVIFLGLTRTMGRAEGGQSAWGDDRPGPAAVEDAFFAGFESEPADMSLDSFSLSLGGVIFNFIFTLEGDQYGPDSISHQTNFGLGDSGSIRLQSGAVNFDEVERFIIVREDGQDFILQSLFVNNRGGAPVMVAGYDNGQQIGDGQTVGSNVATTLSFGALIVDEVRLTSADFYDTNIDAFQGNTAADKDYGDLPTTYGVTSDANNGARHPLGAVYLGSCVDADADGQPSPLADGDDGDGVGTTNGECEVDHADDDGAVLGGNWQNGPGGGSLQVTVSGGDACLSGWIDWAEDGSFSQADDHILDMVPLDPGEHMVTFDVPSGIFTGGGTQLSFFSRLRLTADVGAIGDCGDDAALAATGPAANGEVEDYLWQFSPTAVSLRYTNLSSPPWWRQWILPVALILLAGMTLYATRPRKRRQSP